MSSATASGELSTAWKIAIGVAAALVVIGALVWLMWERIAVATAPKKVAAEMRNEAAQKADELFWATFHGGKYEGIDAALQALTAAYLETPNDPKTAGHIAWSHNWRMAERARVGSAPATITDDAAVARRYFEEAVRLDPSDPRTRGFLAGHTIVEGNLHKDEKLVRKGYFMMLDAVRDWPEFNMFTGGFVFSRLAAETKQFRQGLDWQWTTLDLCIGGKLDRANPDYSPYMSAEPQGTPQQDKHMIEGPKRACWNSWIAPHNLEGFFLNMGDMLVKAGDWRTAQKIYANARLPRAYAGWDFKDVLDQRIANAEANVAIFRTAPGQGAEDGRPRMMIDSEFACMACHQE
jgi:hypothetical protein